MAALDALIDFTATGDNTIITGIAGKRIQINQLALVVSAATTLRFKSGSTNKSGPMPITSNGSVVLDPPADRSHWFRLDTGDGFVINQSGTAAVGGLLTYELVP